MAVEFCRLALTTSAIETNLFPNGDCSSFAIERLNTNPFRGKPGKSLENIIGGNYKEVENLHDDTRIFGASVYPVDSVADTGFSPWLCSLRTRGFRGRHRCGVTLLSGMSSEM